VLERRLSRGHDHFTDGLTPEIVDVQKSKEANRGAEEFFTQGYSELGAELTNINEPLSFKDAERTQKSLRYLDAFFSELFSRGS
jgi:hypothetical protein